MKNQIFDFMIDFDKQRMRVITSLQMLFVGRLILTLDMVVVIIS